MYFENPNDGGIMLRPSWATIWIGWLFREYGDRSKELFLHVHFFPASIEVDRRIYKALIKFLKGRNMPISGSYEAFRSVKEMRIHNDCGCLFGGLSLDQSIKEVQQIYSIGEDGHKMRFALENFLKQIFNG